MIINYFFHTRDPETREINFQGQVKDFLPPDLAFVQLFSFLTGEPTVKRLLRVTESWDFYDTNEAMIEAYQS